MKNWKDKPKNENSLVKQSGLDKLLKIEERNLISLQKDLINPVWLDRKKEIEARIHQIGLTIETIKQLKNV